MRDNRKTNKNIFVVANSDDITIQRDTNKIEGQYSKIRLSSAKHKPRTDFGHMK